MYSTFKAGVLGFLHLPERPPDPPAGGYRVVQVFRASPRWLKYRLALYWLGFAVFALTIGVLFLATLIQAKFVATALVVVIALVGLCGFVLGWFCVRIEFDLRTYVVTDRSLRVREGAWTFKEMTLTYANVQNVQVLQGPIQRLFGIEDLRVDTAGGGGTSKGEGRGTSGHSVTLAGLENARDVRDLILAYVKVASRGSGLGDGDDPDHAPRGSTMQSRDVSAVLRDLRSSAQALRVAAERRTRPL